MLPGDFPQVNKTYVKPDTMSDDECMPLLTHTGFDQSGNAVIISKWIPTDEDIERIKNGSGIWLIVVGVNLPPVTVQTECPFIDV